MCVGSYIAYIPCGHPVNSFTKVKLIDACPAALQKGGLGKFQRSKIIRTGDKPDLQKSKCHHCQEMEKLRKEKQQRDQFGGVRKKIDLGGKKPVSRGKGCQTYHYGYCGKHTEYTSRAEVTVTDPQLGYQRTP